MLPISWFQTRAQSNDEVVNLFQSFVDSDFSRSKTPEYRSDIDILCKCSFNSGDRIALFRSMGDALTHSGNWRGLYNTMRLAKEIFSSGSNCTIAEFHSGKYFDILQRLSILEYYHNDDARIRALIRDTAKDLREELKRIFNSFESESFNFIESPSVPSITLASHSSTIPAAPTLSVSSLDSNPRKSRRSRPQLHTGLVFIGHREDTSSSEDGEEDDNGRHRPGNSNQVTIQNQTEESLIDL